MAEFNSATLFLRYEATLIDESGSYGFYRIKTRSRPSRPKSCQGTNKNR